MIKVRVNGVYKDIPDKINLYNFLESYGVIGKYVAVSHNGEIIDRDKFINIVLRSDDKLEIVQPVGGG